MFSHIHLGASDVEASRRFYDATMAALGAGPGVKDPDRNRYFYHHDGAMLIVGEPLDGEPCSAGNGHTCGFRVASPDQGAAWHTAGLANGGTEVEDPPGVRDRGERGRIFLAYLRDPAGNKLCALKFMDD